MSGAAATTSGATVLVVGSGAREHALADALAASPHVARVVVAPGNAGTAVRHENLACAATDAAGLAAWAAAEKPALAVIGPEAALVAGVADALAAYGVPTFGPRRAAAAIEGSKLFAKRLMDEAGVPTAAWAEVHDAASARAAAARWAGRVAIKADGLAAGKGVVVCSDLAEVDAVVGGFFDGGVGGAEGGVLVEARLDGEELSVLALTDGVHVRVLPAAQDHKRLMDGDRGPNTGGMGAYAPAPRATPALLDEVRLRCIEPVLAALAARGTPFVGVLFAGLMLTADGPQVLEYNARFGDPEAEVILPLVAEDLFTLLHDAARGCLASGTAATTGRHALGVVLASPGYPGRPEIGLPIRGLGPSGGVDGAPEVDVLHAGTARRDDGGFETAGGRVLVVRALGDTLAEAHARAYAAADTIRWSGLQQRHDVGARALRG
jgi:phosphoribosylamine--glycine ligase